jgi:hypothetical protein
MSNGFTFFQGTPSHSASIPKVTIRRNGLLVLTQAAVNMLEKDGPRVQLGFNEKTNAIGLRSTSEAGNGSYLLRKPKKGSSRLVDGKKFLYHLGLSFDSAESFDAEDFGDGVVGFRLPAKK